MTMMYLDRSSARLLVLLHLVKQGFFTLRQELLDGKFVFRVVRVKHLKFLHEIMRNTSI